MLFPIPIAYSGRLGSGSVGAFHHASGSIVSGHVGSGAIFGRPNAGAFTLASGSLGSNDYGSGSVVSGSVASGSIGHFHLSSGCVTSGTIALGGSPIGTNFLRDDYTWASPGAASVGSGGIASGQIASGAAQGFFGATRHLASGTVGVWDFGSGAVTQGAVGSGAVQSGNIASGQIGLWHLQSGLQLSGLILSGGLGSGVVGSFHIASGGVLSGNIGSGQIGRFHVASGLVNSGHIGSGAVLGSLGGGAFTVASGSIGPNDFGSGSVLSGAIASGQIGQFHIASGIVNSGHLSNNVVVSGSLASGQVSTYAFASGATITRALFVGPLVSGSPWTVLTEENVSGLRAVSLSPSGNIRVAMAGTAARMPAIGLVVDGVLSGIQANVYAVGTFQATSGLADYSGYLGLSLFVGRSGQVVTQSGSFNSGGFFSGDIQQYLGQAINSGGFVLELGGTNASGMIGIASGWIGSGLLANAAVVSGSIGSGQVGAFHHASGSVQSGSIASGQIGHFHLASGVVTSGTIAMGGSPTGTNFFRDDFTWAAAGGTVGSGGIASGQVASGTIQGFFGATRHIASGTVGVWDLGSGAVQSGNVASGSLARFHLASGAANSGHIASGAVAGQANAGSFNIASGSIGTFDLASGAIVSGIVASGIVGSFHGSSGLIFDGAKYVYQFASGLNRGPAVITEEVVSGVRAVMISQSGNVRVAMASISGRMPAIGIVVDNVASGIQANVYGMGVFQATSGLADYSGFLGQLIFVGRSGQLVTSSGSFNSGGLLSGDISQPTGVVLNSGCAALSVAAMLPFVPGLMNSGNIASGQLWTTHFASGAQATYSQGMSDSTWTAGETISGNGGLMAVCISSGEVALLAQAGSGLRLPAVGVAVSQVLSGAGVTVVYGGRLLGTSAISGVSYYWSGIVGNLIYVGSGGNMVASGLITSGQFIQRVGVALSGGMVVQVRPVVSSGFAPAVV